MYHEKWEGIHRVSTEINIALWKLISHGVSMAALENLVVTTIFHILVSRNAYFFENLK